MLHAVVLPLCAQRHLIPYFQHSRTGGGWGGGQKSENSPLPFSSRLEISFRFNYSVKNDIVVEATLLFQTPALFLFNPTWTNGVALTAHFSFASSESCLLPDTHLFFELPNRGPLPKRFSP